MSNQPLVTGFMYVTGTTRDSNNTLITKAPMSVIKIPYLPGTYTFSVIFAVSNIDTSKDHNLEVQLNSPEVKEMFKAGPYKLKRTDVPDRMKEDKIVGFVSTVELKNVPFPAEGFYKTTVLMDGQELGTYSIPVIEQKR